MYLLKGPPDTLCGDCRHEAVTAALSEKDAHLALLEVGGVRSSRAAQELETLKKDRTKLLESMKNLVRCGCLGV